MKLKNEETVDWNNWKNLEIESFRKLYIKMRWCKEYRNDLINYEKFLLSVIDASLMIEKILDSTIKRTYGLKRFMLIHSVFNIEDNKKGDWLVKYFIKKLQPTDEEICQVHKKEEIPEDIMSTLAIFKPEPLGYEKYFDNVELHYKYNGNWWKKEQTEPIKIINKEWEGVGKKYEDKEIEEMLDFDFINCYKGYEGYYEMYLCNN